MGGEAKDLPLGGHPPAGGDGAEEGRQVKDYLATAVIIIGFIAVGCGLWAASIGIRNSQDDFISDLHRQGLWASLAAIAAAVAAVLQAIQYFMSK